MLTITEESPGLCLTGPTFWLGWFGLPLPGLAQYLKQGAVTPSVSSQAYGAPESPLPSDTSTLILRERSITVHGKLTFHQVRLGIWPSAQATLILVPKHSQLPLSNKRNLGTFDFQVHSLSSRRKQSLHCLAGCGTQATYWMLQEP